MKLIAAMLSLFAVSAAGQDLNDQTDPWGLLIQDDLAFQAGAAAAERVSGGCQGHSRWPDDVTWCSVPDVDGVGAQMWMTMTRIIEVGAAQYPLAPAFPIRLFHHLCEACENREDRLIYISEVIEVDPETDTARTVMRDGMLTWHTLDLAKMAVSKKLWVRVTVRTDLKGKRNIHGKFRDPIYRLWVLNP